jgi:hypothetical protein
VRKRGHQGLDRAGRPADIDPVVAFLLSDHSAWIRGTHIHAVDAHELRGGLDDGCTELSAGSGDANLHGEFLGSVVNKKALMGCAGRSLI